MTILRGKEGGGGGVEGERLTKESICIHAQPKDTDNSAARDWGGKWGRVEGVNGEKKGHL